MHKKKTALLASAGIAGVIAGGVLMGTMSANAADGSGTTPTSATSSAAAPQGRPGTPPSGSAGNGNTDPTKPMRSDEHLLTGDTLAKVTAAVKAKYPGATFQRVETDSDGVYEAHVLVDSKPVTVEVDKSFTVTGTESKPAAPGGTQGGQGGQPPAGQAPAA